MLKFQNSLMSPMLLTLSLTILLTLVLLAGCGREPQCQQDSDCPAAGDCFESMCDAGICKATIIAHCCGNGICEDTVKPRAELRVEPILENNLSDNLSDEADAAPDDEDATPDDEDITPNTLLELTSEAAAERSPIENKCTCPEDCGECERNVSYTSESGDTVIAKFIKMLCTELRMCEPSYRKEDQIFRREFRETEFDGIIFNSIITYPNPIVTNKDPVVVEIELVEITDPRIVLPINVTSALILEGTGLFGQNLNRYSLDAPEQRVQIAIPITKSGNQPEENHQLSVRLSLEYIYLHEKQVISDGLLAYDLYGRPVMQIVRDQVLKPNLTISLEQSVTMIDLTAAARQSTP
ncbi:MAG: hypothetical protein K9L32_16370 [Chromatiaceae bacterium]|nr:hypothetical protein [Chromatiaceae bacterium]